MYAPHAPHRRSRGKIITAILVVIPLGLLSRADIPLPALIATYGGDTLYATLVYLLAALLRPTRPASQLALVALTVAFTIEFSQLYQAPWITAVRATLPGRLVLGSGFLWSDLVCYAVGVLLGMALDLALRHRR
jgi:hypothetical protein